MQDSTPLIVLAAGGTGGHVFPAEALARELLGRGMRVVLMTDKRGGKFSDDLSVPLHRIHASSLGKGLIGKARSLIEMGIGVLQARKLLAKLKPAVVVGFGGYPSIPTLYAAARVNIPYILHEQNAVLGRANRAMMNKAQFIATSFAHVVGLGKNAQIRLIQTGNPVRPAFAALRGTPYTPVTEDGPFRILVLGGSLGAHVFSEIIPKALARLPEHLRRRLVITQQCRKDDLEFARAGFASIDVQAELSSFFHDVPQRMADAHLIIGRAGGSTIAELTAIGRPAILVPFPHGHAGEQIANAKAVAEAGGAWLIPEAALTPEALAVRIEALMNQPSSLTKAAAAARASGTISAADNLADAVLNVINPPKTQTPTSPAMPVGKNIAANSNFNEPAA